MAFYPDIDFVLSGNTEKHTGTSSHVPTYYGIQYNHSGPLNLCFNHMKEYQVEGPYVFISHPGAYFDYGPPMGKNRHHIFICFLGDRVGQYIQNGFLPLNLENPLIKITHPERFYQVLYELVTAIQKRNLSNDRMVLMLEDLLLQLHEQEDDNKKLPPWQSNHFEALIDAINARLQDDWDFNNEASKMNMTSTHFRRLFKQCTGKPPRQYLLHQRLYKAAERLVHSPDPVSDIAEQVGIADHFYFSRAFKQKYAISPLAYRKEFVGQ